MTFDSSYWHALRPDLEQARKQLAAGQDSQAAFVQLLHSGDPVAVAIALDHYHRADVLTRHGLANPFEGQRGAVITAARELLRGEPSPEGDDVEAGANHASALGALMNLAEPEDAALVTAALERTSSSEVRCMAAAAASTLLERSQIPDERLVSALEALVFNETAGRDARSSAAWAIGRTRSAAATHALLRILTTPDLRLQATAALHLLDSDGSAHRARVSEVVRSWPESPPYPGDEVLDMLRDGQS